MARAPLCSHASHTLPSRLPSLSLIFLFASSTALLPLVLPVSAQDVKWHTNHHPVGRTHYVQGPAVYYNRTSEKLPISPDSPDPKIAALASFLDDCGATGHRDVFVADFERPASNFSSVPFIVRGLGTLRPLNTHETFLCLPDRCRFSIFNMPKRFSKLKKKEPLCHDNDHMVVAPLITLWLAEEWRLQQHSSWWPFLAMLPSWDDYNSFHPGMLFGATPGRWARTQVPLTILSPPNIPPAHHSDEF